MKNISNIKRPALRYHGGKYKLAPWIISHFPPHRIYTEVYGGGCSVLLRKKRAYAEVYNDKWDIVVNVFKVLRNAELANNLENQIRLTPYSRTEFNYSGDAQIAMIQDPVEKARLTILRSFAGFGSAATNARHATGFRANSNRSGTTPATDWAGYPDNIKSFIERLQGVVIENKDAIEVLKQHDSIDTLHYVDPPYVHSTRNMNRGNAAYAHEMTDSDHVELSKVLHELDGMVVLSGYDSELYKTLYPNWKLVTKEALADGARKRTECLWINHAAFAAKYNNCLF